ncbi:MAG: hypothetical protein MUD09_00645 [Desulfobacterales bacterium]|nr:hypothetical protein [Desulfobacterales bacterium]
MKPRRLASCWITARAMRRFCARWDWFSRRQAMSRLLPLGMLAVVRFDGRDEQGKDSPHWSAGWRANAGWHSQACAGG